MLTWNPTIACHIYYIQVSILNMQFHLSAFLSSMMWGEGRKVVIRYSKVAITLNIQT